jgi:hypothetical protein
MAKRKSLFFGTVLNIISAVPSFFSLANHLMALLEHETKMAGRNLLYVLLLLLMAMSLVTMCWWCLMGMLFFYLISIALSYQMSLLIIFFINIICLIIVSLMIKNAKKNMFYPHTRHLIKSAFRGE